MELGNASLPRKFRIYNVLHKTTLMAIGGLSLFLIGSIAMNGWNRRQIRIANRMAQANALKEDTEQSH